MPIPTAQEARTPLASLLSLHSERDLLVKILCELRVANLIAAQASGFTDDLSTLRDDVMAGGNQTLTDI